MEEGSPEGRVGPERAAGHRRGKVKRSCSGVFPLRSSFPAGCGGEKISCTSWLLIMVYVGKLNDLSAVVKIL